MRTPWKRIVQVVVLLLALGFLAALLATQWQALQAYEWRLEPGWALLALIGLGLGWLWEVGLWRYILGSLGGSLRYWQALRIWFLSNIVRYIPGNVWQFLSMVELAAEQGVGRLATLTSIMLHQAISTAAGLALAALYFAWAGEGVWFARLRPFLYALPLGLLLLQPRLLERGLNWLLARLRRPPLRVTLTWAQIWALLGGYAIVWLVMGASFAALVRALTPVTWAQLPTLVAVFTAAYVIGFLSLLTPSGLGVREGVMTLLLATTLPAGVAAVVAIVARLWMVVGELIGAGVSLLVGTRYQILDIGRRVTGLKPRNSNIQYPISSTQYHLPRLLLLTLILAYTVGFSTLSIRLHQAHLTHTADLGQMDLAIWNTSRGRFVQEIKHDFVSTRLTDHVEPIFAPVSLIFWLWNDVRALLILQSFALAIGALPVFLLARSRVRGSGFGVRRSQEWLGLLFAFAYLMFPALQAANLTEFHAIPLAVPFILFAFWFAERGQWGRFAVANILLMAVKEEAALLAFMLGLCVIAKSQISNLKSRFTNLGLRITNSPRGLATGTLIVLLSLAWFSITTFIIITFTTLFLYRFLTITSITFIIF